jgi:hypothetical protein
MRSRPAGFYRDIGASVGLRIPTCYGVLFDEASYRFALLLEDLSAYCAPAAATPLLRKDMEAVVRGLAASHGAWWGGARLAGISWLASIGAASVRLEFWPR